MDWDDIRVFVEVARSQGLTGAARKLKTSPQTVGRRVSALEAATGNALFLRGPTGYQLTDDGRALLADAERIEEGIAQFQANASGRSSSLAGTVRLAAPENYVTLLLAPAIGAFLNRYPELQVEFITGIAPVSMARGDADLALRLVRPESGELTVRRVGTMTNALYATSAYLASNPGVRADPLNQGRLIGWDEPHAHLPAARWMAAHVPRKPNITFTTIAAQRAAVAAGLGIGFLPCFLAGDGLEKLLPEKVLSEPIWLVANAAGLASDRIRAVYGEVMRIMTDAHHMLVD
jgi:DNA-binding transcriptional LysR family regulator